MGCCFYTDCGNFCVIGVLPITYYCLIGGLTNYSHLDAKWVVLQAPTVGTHNWKHNQRDTDSPGGPNYSNRDSYKSGTTTISTPVTVLEIHSHSRQCKKMYNTIILPTSRGINANWNINASPIQNPTNNLHLMSRALHHYFPPYKSSRSDYTNDHKTFL